MRPRETAADVEASRVRRARARADVVAQMPAKTAPRRSPVHDEATSPVLIPVQQPQHDAAPPSRRPAAWRIALTASVAFVLFLYAWPVGAALGWW